MYIFWDEYLNYFRIINTYCFSIILKLSPRSIEIVCFGFVNNDFFVFLSSFPKNFQQLFLKRVNVKNLISRTISTFPFDTF